MNNKPMLFAKVIIHGIVSNYNTKELKNGKTSIKISISIANNASVQQKENYIPAEIDIYVDKQYLVEKTKKILSIGSYVLVDGRISLMFIKNNDKLSRKIQYISADDIVCKKNYKDQDTSDQNQNQS